MSLAEVKPLRNGAAALTDIPSMLRELADLIESGVYGEVKYAVVLRDVDNAPPAVHGYGVEATPNDALRLVTCAQAEIVRMMTNGEGRIVRNRK